MKFTVRGIPRPQPRARATARGGFARVYDPGTAENWKAMIANAVRDITPAVPLEGPLRVDIALRFPRPKYMYGTGRNSAVIKPKYAGKWHAKKPDRDNCEKAILDTLTELGFWRDDSQVCCGEVTKQWADQPSGAGADIEVTEVT